MKVDPYCDRTLGEWKFDKKATTKQKFAYKRTARVLVPKDFAMDYIDPDTQQKQHVHGEVILTETKYVDAKNSQESFFRQLKLTDKSVVKDAIP